MIRLALLITLLAGPAAAQDLTLSLGEGGAASGRILHLLVLVTLLSLVPGIAVMVTCFPFIVTVLSILRQALGLQAAPPNMLIVTLALFLSWYVMDPVLTAAWQAGGGALCRWQHAAGGSFSKGCDAFSPLHGGAPQPGDLRRA